MAWYDNDNNINGLDKGSTPAPTIPTPPKEEVMEMSALGAEQLKALSKQFGFELGKSPNGDYVVMPPEQIMAHGANLSDDSQQFLDHWLTSSPEKQSVEQNRKVRNSSYALMDEIFGIAILTLNAYADEALGIGFIDQPVDIEISDKKIEEGVKEILSRNGTIKRARSQMRSLVKWGDLGAKVILPTSNDPLDIKIKMMTPDKWEAFFLEQAPVPLGYSLTPKYGQSSQKRLKGSDLLQPWEFVQFSVPEDEFAPYGRSLLEAMRTSFDQLATIEALLALSRATKIERLIIKVPTEASNPTAAMAKINQLGAAFKNTIFKSGGTGKNSHAKTPALQDVMVFPSDDGFSIERMAAGSGVEFSNTDDVEFFRDNVLMMTGLPKGYLLADESTDRYHALTAQDLKFARQLIPYQDAYATGLTKLCMVLAGYLGADLETVKVTVKIKRPIQMSDQLLQNNEAISRTAIEMIDNFKRANTTSGEEGEEVVPTLPEDTYAKVLAELGMSDNLIKIFTASTSDDPELPTNSPNDTGISGASNKATLSDCLESRDTAVKVTSQEVYAANRKLFEFFSTGARAGGSVLLEALSEAEDGSKPTYLKEDGSWMN